MSPFAPLRSLPCLTTSSLGLFGHLAVAPDHLGLKSAVHRHVALSIFKHNMARNTSAAGGKATKATKKAAGGNATNATKTAPGGKAGGKAGKAPKSAPGDKCDDGTEKGAERQCDEGKGALQLEVQLGFFYHPSYMLLPPSNYRPSRLPEPSTIVEDLERDDVAFRRMR
eukprot:TRINITY_DN1059_c0_g4_i3.p2 TRINITY_DN1059_c0_g4~~TRINITY_DN1059_c0_g4_i3.p2  ORF type:complete len:169 (+),score=14.85 TRINITY_DN1059_c0_g4_i3:234-740(+)